MKETGDTGGFGTPLKTSETAEDVAGTSAAAPAATSSSNSSLASLSTSTPNSNPTEDKENRSPSSTKSDKPCVTFDPNPTILLTQADGSPLKSRDNAKKDLPPKGPSSSNQRNNQQPVDDQPEDCYLKDLCGQISEVLASNPETRTDINEDEAEDPKLVPMIWVTKWVDYSDKYGLGYQLCDETIGVLYNDFTKLLVLPDGDSMHYIDKSGGEYYHTLKTYPSSLDKKVTLLRYFKKYMNDHLLKAAASMCPTETAMMARVPTLRTYFRTRSAIILHLTNGTLQINFYEDHTKIILCPLLEAVTYIDQNQLFRTYKFSGLQEHGCSSALLNRLRYAKNMLQKLMLNKTSSSKVTSSSNAGRTTSASSAQ